MSYLTIKSFGNSSRLILFSSGIPTKNLYVFLLPNVLYKYRPFHFFISLPWWYLLIIATYEAPHLAILCCLLLLPPLKPKYHLRYSFFEHSQTTKCQRKSCICVYFNIYSSNSNRIWFNYISTKSLMVFKGGDPVRSKTVIDKVIEQGNSCNHFKNFDILWSIIGLLVTNWITVGE